MVQDGEDLHGFQTANMKRPCSKSPLVTSSCFYATRNRLATTRSLCVYAGFFSQSELLDVIIYFTDFFLRGIVVVGELF